MFRKTCVFIISSIGVLIFLSFKTSPVTDIKLMSLQDTAKWIAPASADSLKSPLDQGPETIAKGEELFGLYCWPCHGEAGFGDGPAGGSGPIRPANFHDKETMAQKDGALFWKMTQGRGIMPPFKEALTVEQRWQLVAFLRNLSKQ